MMSLIRNRTIVAAIGLPALLLGALHAGSSREHASLPRSAAQLRLAVIDAGGVLTCFQGVQDEIYVPGVGRVSTPAAIGAARSRLATCDVGELETQLGEVDLPPQAALDGGPDRHARSLIVGALTALQQVVIESDGTKRAMAANITDNRQGELMVLGFRAAQLGYDRANGLYSEVQAIYPSAGD